MVCRDKAFPEEGKRVDCIDCKKPYFDYINFKGPYICANCAYIRMKNRLKRLEEK